MRGRIKLKLKRGVQTVDGAQVTQWSRAEVGQPPGHWAMSTSRPPHAFCIHPKHVALWFWSVSQSLWWNSSCLCLLPSSDWPRALKGREPVVFISPSTTLDWLEMFVCVHGMKESHSQRCKLLDRGLISSGRVNLGFLPFFFKGGKGRKVFSIFHFLSFSKYLWYGNPAFSAYFQCPLPQRYQISTLLGRGRQLYINGNGFNCHFLGQHSE